MSVKKVNSSTKILPGQIVFRSSPGLEVSKCKPMLVCEISASGAKLICTELDAEIVTHQPAHWSDALAGKVSLQAHPVAIRRRCVSYVCDTRDEAHRIYYSQIENIRIKMVGEIEKAISKIRTAVQTARNLPEEENGSRSTSFETVDRLLSEAIERL